MLYQFNNFNQYSGEGVGWGRWGIFSPLIFGLPFLKKNFDPPESPFKKCPTCPTCPTTRVFKA